MIVFDLSCATGHVFEAWFGSSDDYEGQRARGLVSCPICGSDTVEKAVMAPAVAAKGNSRAVVPAPIAPVAMRNGGPAPQEVKAMMAALAHMQAKALEGSEHVGTRFAEEARAIHDGTADERRIHGKATLEEARALVEDGVAVAALPFPVLPPEYLQ